MPPPRATPSTSPALPHIRVPKTAELVAERIRRQVVGGQLQDGEALPSEQALIEMHGVSRPTLREALRLLEADGLLYMQRGRGGGARVSAPDGAAAASQVGLMFEYLRVPLTDLVDASNLIELGAAETLARKRTRADLAALKANVREGEACLDDPAALVRVTTAFHSVMVQRVGNQALAFLYGVLNNLISDNVLRANDPDPVRWGRLAPTEGQQRHDDVVRLIEARDAEAADVLWREHVAACRSFALQIPGAVARRGRARG